MDADSDIVLNFCDDCHFLGFVSRLHLLFSGGPDVHHPSLLLLHVHLSNFPASRYIFLRPPPSIVNPDGADRLRTLPEKSSISTCDPQNASATRRCLIRSIPHPSCFADPLSTCARYSLSSPYSAATSSTNTDGEVPDGRLPVQDPLLRSTTFLAAISGASSRIICVCVLLDRHRSNASNDMTPRPYHAYAYAYPVFHCHDQLRVDDLGASCSPLIMDAGLLRPPPVSRWQQWERQR
ncbi:hypothetical protein K438DRAFT_371781 [Mycena galopus ATCC 62051]|nr:hypothetical protein K438DRAFT_371781 [Mycena galopus ATCC 62051]